MTVPLDKLHVIVGSGKGKQTVPALDPCWVEQVQFVSYQPPPDDLGDGGQYEAWLERLRFIEDDLHWLLQLPHDKFWCQAVFDETLHRFIDSYLRFAPRSPDVIQKLPDIAREKHKEVHRLVFMTCLRMATYKESKECHITPNVFGEILYENFLFDIPKILDLCVLYGHGNKALLSKMVENIFTQQPNYNDDLVHTVETLSKVFDSVMEKCGVQRDQGAQSPQKLSEGTSNQSTLLTMEISEFKDVVMYMADIGVTLTSFLDVYPPACQAFHDSDFLMKLPSFYEHIVPEMMSALRSRDMDTWLKQSLKQQMASAKKGLLTVFQQIMLHRCIQPVLEKRELVIDYVEDYLHIMSSVLGERRFLADYESLHSFQEDLDILALAQCGIDETRLQYIRDAVNGAFATYGKRKSPKGATKRGGRRSPDGSDSQTGVSGATATSAAAGSAHSVPSDAYQVEDYDTAGACMPEVTGVELESMISSVKDLLPELGEGFIELCLEELGYDVERVINGILEDRLPPSLQEVDRTMARKPRAATPPSLVRERKNIYDYDEFDVFHRDDIDKRKVRKGKTNKTDTVSVGDQLALTGLKDSINRDYGVIQEVVTDTGSTEYAQDVYEDEYDDTYDTNVVGAADADSADELTLVRPFTTPRVLGGGKTDSSAKKSESEESEEDEKGQVKQDKLIEDPAVLRQRAEDRAKWKAARAKPSHVPKSHDVKGGPKGQGQSAEVLRNRRWKTQHKGEYRRAAADKKRKV